MPGTWDGRTERRNNATDHDTLVQLVEIVTAHVSAAKIVADNLKEHEIRDQNNFDGIRKDILACQRVVWVATGIIVALDTLPKVTELIHAIK